VAQEKHSEDQKKKGRFSKIEIEVVKYVVDMRREGFPVTVKSIQVKGREIARNLCICEFKASMSWCKRMMRRNWLVMSLLNFLFFSKYPARLIFGDVVFRLIRYFHYANRLLRALKDNVLITQHCGAFM
jgi:hypothetical protein